MKGRRVGGRKETGAKTGRKYKKEVKTQKMGIGKRIYRNEGRREGHKSEGNTLMWKQGKEDRITKDGKKRGMKIKPVVYYSV